MDRFNDWLLCIFAGNDRFNNQVESLGRRLQTLNLIYINLFIMLLSTISAIVFKFVGNSPDAFFLLLEMHPLLLLNLILIRKRKLEAATMLLAIALILSNQIVSDFLQQPLTSIAGLMFYPSILLFSAASIKVLVISSLLGVIRFYFISIQVYQMLDGKISQEQLSHIIAFLIMGMLISGTISLLAILQKILERKVWSLAQENYHRSETLNKEMILAMEAKDRFISMVSHEIRNPLNTLKGSVEYLIQVENDPMHMKILKSAQLSGEILLNLVNNVLDAAKLKSDKIEIYQSYTSFIGVVKKAFTVNSELLKEKKLVAKAYIDENLAANIWVDPSRLLQVLLNLISNAVKFTPKGGKIEIYAEWCGPQEAKESLLKPLVNFEKGSKVSEPQQQEEDIEISEMESDEMILFNKRIEQIDSPYEIKKRKKRLSDGVTRCETEEEIDPWEVKITKLSSASSSSQRGGGPLRVDRGDGSGYLKVQVMDTGSGIAANEMPKLFGMFEQATEHSRSVYGGSGLGLWICKQICQKMNGDITLYSEINKGSSFVLYIPVHNNPQRKSMGLLQGPPGFVVRNEKIRALVVDDFLTNQYLHKLLLEQQGVLVTLASDGQEAVEKYKAQGNGTYNFILMDVNMPVMDGFTAAKRIREWEIEAGKKQTDIYFVTGEYFNEADVLNRFKGVGGSGNGIKYLSKPLDRETLKKVVMQYK